MVNVLSSGDIADALRYCWNHADEGPEEDVIQWVAEKFAERLNDDPHFVDGYVHSITGRRVYAHPFEPLSPKHPSLRGYCGKQ